MPLFQKKKCDFCEMLHAQSEKVLEGLNALYNWAEKADQAQRQRVKEIEREADELRRILIEELNQTFVTPFDREDIAELAHSMDDVTDFIHSAADAMLIYKIEQPTRRAKELVDILLQATLELEKALPQLRQSGRKLQQILKHCIEINRLENMADRVFRAAQGELFDENKDMKQIILWREIYEHMETATDRAEDVANVLEGVALKHA